MNYFFHGGLFLGSSAVSCGQLCLMLELPPHLSALAKLSFCMSLHRTSHCNSLITFVSSTNLHQVRWLQLPKVCIFYKSSSSQVVTVAQSLYLLQIFIKSGGYSCPSSQVVTVAQSIFYKSSSKFVSSTNLHQVRWLQLPKVVFV